MPAIQHTSKQPGGLQKGGNGKTTLAIHLAVLASESNKVILLDLDPQGSAIEWASRRGDRPPDITPTHLALAKEIERARDEGYTFAVIDTAPHGDHAALQGQHGRPAWS